MSNATSIKLTDRFPGVAGAAPKFSNRPSPKTCDAVCFSCGATGHKRSRCPSKKQAKDHTINRRRAAGCFAERAKKRQNNPAPPKDAIIEPETVTVVVDQCSEQPAPSAPPADFVHAVSLSSVGNERERGQDSSEPLAAGASLQESAPKSVKKMKERRRSLELEDCVRDTSNWLERVQEEKERREKNPYFLVARGDKPAPPRPAAKPATPEPPPEKEWWDCPEYEDLAKSMRGWHFSFHDFPVIWRNERSRVVFLFSFLPFLVVLGLVLLWYPNLETLSACVILFGTSLVIRHFPSLVPAYQLFSGTLVSFVDACVDWHKDSFRLSSLFRKTSFFFLGHRTERPLWHYLAIFEVLTIVVSFCILMVAYILFRYFEVFFLLANVAVTYESYVWHWILPSNFWYYWDIIPIDVRHILAWTSWVKYLVATYFLLSHYAAVFLKSTSITSVTFVEFVHERSAVDKRQLTFRNQDLLAKSCPFKVAFSRHTVFGLVPLLYEEREASACMVMELTAHKFLNGSVELTDTVDRINRAMQGIGYLDIDAQSVFRNVDAAEASRLIAVSWAKFREEVNFGLRLQDF